MGTGSGIIVYKNTTIIHASLRFYDGYPSMETKAIAKYLKKGLYEENIYACSTRVDECYDMAQWILFNEKLGGDYHHVAGRQDEIYEDMDSMLEDIQANAEYIYTIDLDNKTLTVKQIYEDKNDIYPIDDNLANTLKKAYPE